MTKEEVVIDVTESYITELNKNADEYTTDKVVYIARHGEGYHNRASHSSPVQVLSLRDQRLRVHMVSKFGILIGHNTRISILMVLLQELLHGTAIGPNSTPTATSHG